MSLSIDEETYKQRKKKSFVKQICILLVISLVGMFIILMLLFILIRNTPSSPYSIPLSELLSQEMIDLWGLDKTPIQQFFIFLWNLISGNCGESLIIRRGVPVKEASWNDCVERNSARKVTPDIERANSLIETAEERTSIIKEIEKNI